MAVQGSLFPVSDLPEGLLYQPDFLSMQEESELLRIFSTLEFQAFDFHGYTARRRVLEFGLEYDFTSRKATPTQNFPEFLAVIRERAAAFAELPQASLVEGMVSEYPPGAPIGWHRDAPQFGTIIGISLASVSRMRFKPYKAEGAPFRARFWRKWAENHLPDTGTALHLSYARPCALALSAQHPAGKGAAVFNYLPDFARRAEQE